MTRCPSCGESLASDARFCGVCGTKLPDPNVGRVVGGRYVLRELIGSGALGFTYRADQLGLARKLAIKILPADPTRDPTVVARFRREGSVLVNLRSPHTVTTYEYDTEADGTLYIAMELSPGRSLADLFRAEGALDWRRVLHILRGLCDSLAEAHQLGIVHRDLRPQNILVEMRPTHRDYVKVTDFGLAKVITDSNTPSPTPVGKTVGTIQYSSPEQLMSKPIDGRTDLYALGILGFLLVTGHHPFETARSFGDLVTAHIKTVPPRASVLKPDVPPDVDEILARCLEKDPARRYPDAQALGATIELALANIPPQQGDTIPSNPGEEDTMMGAIPKPPVK
ncbi:MAG: protein kinase [Deltaproteobacteria bacterium]|nr:protein kinase [Deltaproteobacteria bacterium]